jgi:Tol biopolymer transport system component
VYTGLASGGGPRTGPGPCHGIGRNPDSRPDPDPVEHRDAFDIFLMPSEGGESVQLTHGPGHSDGAEFSPDGAWIYFNTEMFSTRPGHAQIARMRTDGSGLEQLTFDDRVNWFPHLAPTGERALYLSYPPGTVGHPENRQVDIRLVDHDWSSPTIVASLLGGQGTINVNSWSPDGLRFAFVAYPIG